jgi:L-2-hydroxyglutarate oxidase LhgO
MPSEVDVAVVGGGVVGLACAASLARSGRSVLVLERGEGIARGVTSRSSEVLHAGLYYPPDSLKARLCVRGRELLAERCSRLRLPHRWTGKIVVATELAEIPVLEALRDRGEGNGAAELELIDGRRVAQLEPAVRARLGLLSPNTGIVDAHALALSFAAEAEADGGLILLESEVREISQSTDGYRLEVLRREGERERVVAAAVVNAGGLDADAIAALAGIDVEASGYRQHPCKGDYFSLAPGAPLRFSRLVYPLSQGAGLGIHTTSDLAGRVRFGPDAAYVDRVGYEVDPDKAPLFSRAIRRYVPSFQEGWLAPDFAGVRPKLAGPGETFRDFVVAEESARGLPGFINLIGIESPGLTASPAIAERVAALLGSGS